MQRLIRALNLRAGKGFEDPNKYAQHIHRNWSPTTKRMFGIYGWNDAVSYANKVLNKRKKNALRKNP